MISKVLSTLPGDVNLSLPRLPDSFIELIRIDDPRTPNPIINYFDVPQPFAASAVQFAEITSVRELCGHEADVKQVYEIELRLPEKLDYLPGNTIGILPENRMGDVEFVMTRVLEDCDGGIYRMLVASDNQKKAAKLPVYVPTMLAVDKVLTHCLDLRTIPKKLFLRTLAEHTIDPDEKRSLEILCSKEGAGAYNEFVLNQKLSFIALLRILRSCELPFSVLLEHLPRLMSRPYSIASYNVNDLQRLKIVFSVQHNGDVIEGLTTGMMVEKINSPTEPNGVYVYLRQSSTFQYSAEDVERDIILIGPGTGIAPFIGFLQFREAMLSRIAGSKAWLFTGCRYETKNNLYAQELVGFGARDVLDEVSSAFSRDPNSSFKYVQDCIAESKEKFVQLLMRENTKMFVCGEGKIMLPGIEAAIVKCWAEVNRIEVSEALQQVKGLKKDKRYLEDVWF